MWRHFLNENFGKSRTLLRPAKIQFWIWYFQLILNTWVHSFLWWESPLGSDEDANCQEQLMWFIGEMNGPKYLGFSWISVSNTLTLSKIQKKGFCKRPDDALKTCSWNLQKLSRVERLCLPTLFWPIYFLTNSSFGLSRTCIFIPGCVIAFSKKSRLIRGSPLTATDLCGPFCPDGFEWLRILPNMSESESFNLQIRI